MYFQAGPQVLKSHPVSAVVSVSSVKAVENHFKCSSRLNSVWKKLQEDNTRSVVWCDQIFSDKSLTSLKVGRLTFYHITFLNFSDKMRPRQSLSGDTTVAHVSVSFHLDSEKGKVFKPLPKQSRRMAF